MKTIKILLLLSLLAVTQSFALTKTERHILLGLGVSPIVIHTLESHNKTIYTTSHNSHNKNKRHRMKKYHKNHKHRNKHYCENKYKHNFTIANKHHKKVHFRY